MNTVTVPTLVSRHFASPCQLLNPRLPPEGTTITGGAAGHAAAAGSYVTVTVFMEVSQLDSRQCGTS